MAEIKLQVLVVLAAIIIGAVLLWPFLTPLAFAAVLAFLLHPVHNWLSKRITGLASATLLTILAIASFLALIFLGFQVLLAEFGKIFVTVSQVDFSRVFPNQPELATSLGNATRFVISKLIEKLSGAVSKIPGVLLSLFVFFVTFFFFLKDGVSIVHWLRKNIPLPENKKKLFFDALNRYAHAFISVWLVIGALQAVVAFAGFWVFGLPYPLLAALAAAVLSILPVIGPYTLYVPVGIGVLLRGDPAIGFGILTYGLVLGSLLDYVLRPYLAGKWIDVHPLVILLGILGGILLLGPAGFIIGPVVLLTIIAVVKGTSVDFFKS